MIAQIMTKLSDKADDVAPRNVAHFARVGFRGRHNGRYLAGEGCFPGALSGGADTSSLGAGSYSGLATPNSQWSNQPTMCCSRSTRCQAWPERDNSCDSFGKRTITVGIFRYFNARNISSPPAPGGVR